MKKVKMSKDIKKLIEGKKIAKLDIGGGGNPTPGFINMDYRDIPGKVDITHDLTLFPWPIEDETFDVATCSHVVEHLSPLPVDPRIAGLAQLLLDKKIVSQKDLDKYVGEIAPGPIFMRFMDEAWRVLKVGGELLLSGPYAGSPGFYQDPSHINACNETTWEYFTPKGPLTGGVLWGIYKSKPWKIKLNTWHQIGFFEVVLEKIAFREDGKY